MAALVLCLAVAFALLPLSPAPSAGGDSGMAMAATADAPPCHDEADGDCGGAAFHCTACHVLALSSRLQIAPGPGVPRPVLRRTADTTSLSRPGVPHGPPRLA